MPPSLREWLPEDHLAWFVIEAVEQIDLAAFYAAYRADGHGRGGVRAVDDGGAVAVRVFHEGALVSRRAAAITRAHRAADHPTPLADPRVKSVLEGIARTHGTPSRKKAALDRDELLAVIAAIDPATTAGLRDRALLLVGFALGLRRSELVALQVEDLKPHPDGLLVTLNRAKGDQHGHGHTFLLAHGKTAEACPVTALHAWIARARLTNGPIARRVSRDGRVLDGLTAQSIPLIIRRRLEAAHLPGVNLDDYAGHSLRSGFATQAARDGYTPTQIRHVTRHKDARALDGYIQAGTGARDLARVL